MKKNNLITRIVIEIQGLKTQLNICCPCSYENIRIFKRQKISPKSIPKPNPEPSSLGEQNLLSLY